MSSRNGKLQTPLKAMALVMASLMLQATLAPSIVLAAIVVTGPDGPIQQQDPQQPQDQPESMLIGVIDLEPINVDEDEARMITERLRLYLGRQAIFDVLERNKMEDILEEQGFQLTGACQTSEECLIQVGRILGARKMVAGSVGKVGNLYTLQIRLVDIETARIELEVFEDVNGIEQVLQVATEGVAIQLSTAVVQALTPTPEPAEEPPDVEPPVADPPVQEQEEEQRLAEDPGEAETGQQPVRKSKTWLYLLGVAVVGGGAAMALGGGGGDSGGGVTVTPIGSPPTRPVPPM
jgi:hypothetical protein